MSNGRKPSGLLTPERIRAALEEPLPGPPGQLWMAPQPRVFVPDRPVIEAAVLILLHPCDEGLCFPLTLRPSTLPTHQGQVSLPGGAREGEEALAETARRETCEELGVPLDEVEMLGTLTPLYIAVSGYEVTPFVGHVPCTPNYRPNIEEVAEIVETPLALLLDPAARDEADWNLPDGRHLHVPFFQIGDHQVWGATAVILGEFVLVLRRILESSQTT